MKSYEIVPHVGVGPVRLGMSREDVRRVMPAPCESFLKTPDDAYETDAFHDSGFQVFYSGDSPAVAFIELSRDSGFTATYRGLDVFATQADQLVAHVALDGPFDRNNPELGYSFVFPHLDLSVWRPIVPESPEDAEGHEFATIGVGVPGYFSERA